MKPHIQARISELMVPVEKAIMLTDNDKDMLMLACGMLQRTVEIFETLLGEEGRKEMFKDLA